MAHMCGQQRCTLHEKRIASVPLWPSVGLMTLKIAQPNF
jgi:hypothetical protein